MSTCIISGRFPVTNFKSYINHKIYADKYGYNYIHCNWPTGLKNSYLNKIVYILSVIDYFDNIIWIDDDAFFFDFEKDIMDYAPKAGSFISLCKSPSYKEIKTYFSSGQFIVKSNKLSKAFFEDILNTEFKLVEKWWSEKLGYFTNGDQDIMVYLLLEQEKYKEKMDLYDYKCFNSRCENIFDEDVHKPFILHFTGRGKTKEVNLLKVQKKLNRHPSLVINSILKDYNIKIFDQYPIVNKRSNKQTLLSRVKNKIMQWSKD